MTQAPTGSGAVRMALLVAAAAGMAIAEWPALAGIVYMWTHSPMYSYGWLVPAISGFLLWSQRDRLAALPARPALAPGFAVLAVWALMLVAGRVGGILLLEQLALIVGIVALVLVFAGWEALRASWAAIAYLLLGVPLWDGFTEPLHLRFQLLSAGIGVSMLQRLGIPAHGVGTFIELPTLRIEVARACSGVNYLIAVLALGLPLAYLYLRTWWRRVLLVGAAMGIAALSNSLRVAIIGILVYYDLGAPLHGPAHVLHGLFVSAIGHVVLFVGLWWLRRSEPAEAVPDAAPSIAPRSAAPARLAALACAVALAWIPIVWTAAAMPTPVALLDGLERLPAQLGPWAADPFSTPATPEWWPAPDQHLSRRYRSGDEVIDVFVGYFEQQRQAHEVVTYRATALHRDAQEVVLTLPDGPLPVNRATVGRGGDRRELLFWYEIDGHAETQPLATKLRTLWHALGRRRSNGAIVCLSRPIGPDGPGADQHGLLDLAPRLYAALAQSLPGRRDDGLRLVSRATAGASTP